MGIGKYAIAGATIGVLGTGVSRLFDSKKGSLTNRKECAMEHIKNDFNFMAKAGTVIGGSALAVNLAPKTTSKILGTVGKGIRKVVEFIGKKAKSPKVANMVNYMAKHPVRAGAAGLALAGGLYLFNSLFKNVMETGKIDQKYDDAAKIESQTKNIVLQNKISSPDDVKDFYNNGGKGLFC